MKTFLLVIKGVLMYSTLIYWVLVIALANNFDATLTLIAFGVGFAMIFICKYTLTLEDVAILTGNDSKEL
mgnify:CR=1 FL=1